MTDYFKTSVVNPDIDSLIKNPLLDFQTLVNEYTGEIKSNKKRAFNKGLIFEIVNDKHLNISGSLHKYFNNGVHNYNDFSYLNLLQVLNDIYSKFRLRPEQLELHNLEFGVNINLPFDPGEIIRENVIFHKGKIADTNSYRGCGYLKQFVHSQFIIKIYDKGKQHKLSKFIMRIEIKCTKMQYLKSMKIKTIDDLLDVNILKRLSERLLSVFNEILIVDSIDDLRIDEKEKIFCKEIINPIFWERSLAKSKDYHNGNKDNEYQNARQKYYRIKGKAKKIINKYNLNESKILIYNLIDKKCEELIIC